jgi:hypothetical protein
MRPDGIVPIDEGRSVLHLRRGSLLCYKCRAKAFEHAHIHDKKI